MEGNRAVESNPGLEPVGSIIGHSRTFADLIQEKTHFQRLYEQEKSRCHFLYERYAKYYMAKLQTPQKFNENSDILRDCKTKTIKQLQSKILYLKEDLKGKTEQMNSFKDTINKQTSYIAHLQAQNLKLKSARNQQLIEMQGLHSRLSRHDYQIKNVLRKSSEVFRVMEQSVRNLEEEKRQLKAKLQERGLIGKKFKHINEALKLSRVETRISVKPTEIFDQSPVLISEHE